MVVSPTCTNTVLHVHYSNYYMHVCTRVYTCVPVHIHEASHVVLYVMCTTTITPENNFLCEKKKN